LALLEALTPADWEVVIQDENIQPAEFIGDADLVGITTFTANATRAYELATLYRQNDVQVVMGGVHVWARQEEALSYADSIVVREAESVWSRVCHDAEKVDLSRWYQGMPLDRFAVPKRSSLPSFYAVDSIATSRGCPFDCSFCSVHEFSGHRYRRQPVRLIVEDFAGIKNPWVFFCDDNFIGPDRDYVIRILQKITPFKKRFICQATMSICQDDELLAVLREAGCRLIFIGAETNDTAGLRLIGKHQNLRYGFDFSRIHAAGIGVLGSFVVGLDTDTPDTLREHSHWMMECGADALQLTFVTPLPGTRLFNELLRDGRLFYTDFPKDWDHYDLTEMVYVPRGFKKLSQFYDLMAELATKIFSNDNLSAMTARTYEMTKCKEVTTVADRINRSYAAMTLEKMKMWTERTDTKFERESK
jgi:radical SAM superfamily enzyme YgiQ (UPF0313 family)